MYAANERRSRQIATKSSARAHLRAALELLEPRFPLDADPLHIGMIYIEEDIGSDKQGDHFELTFSGGAPNTQLKSILLDSNMDPVAFGVGDNLFDTIEFGTAGDVYGADHAFPFKVISHDGIDDVKAFVTDGSSLLRIDFVGFEAGERLVFSIDVDEVEEFDPQVTNPNAVQEGLDPITSGVEFQGTKLTADFVAPNYQPATIQSIFRNRYDEGLIASGLDLPADDAQGKRDRSAGAFGQTAQVPLPISLAGHVFEDLDLDLKRESNEPLLPGVTVELWKSVDGTAQGPFVFTGLTAQTNSVGRYEFSATLGLLPSVYQVRERQPNGYLSVGAIPGRRSDGQVAGTVDATNRDILLDIRIPVGGLDVVDLDFAEARPAQVSGYVFYDPNQDVIRQSNESGIAGSRLRVIPVRTIDPQQKTIELTTDGQGAFSATGLAPGEYRIEQIVQPEGYFDSLDAAGTVQQVVVGTAVNPGDSIQGVVLYSGQSGVDYRFGEILAASLSGSVHASAPDGNCYEDESQAPPIAGVLIELFDATTNQRLAETRTDAQGTYQFTGLRPGTFRIVEHTPAGWLDGEDHVGTVRGRVVGVQRSNDRLEDIVLGSGDDGVDYDFCEVRPASLAGHVFHDLDDDGLRELTEPGIAAVTLELLDTTGQVLATTQTTSTGDYLFRDLRPGTYAVREKQPAGWLDGQEQLGTVSGQPRGTIATVGDLMEQITLQANDQGVNYDFGELLPISLLGSVHLVDKNGDCFSDNVFHEPVEGAVVRLFDSQGTLVEQTVTDALGHYAFVNLKPGTYKVVESTPVGMLDGGARVGQVNGVEIGKVLDPGTVSDIALVSGSQGIRYDFCESLPAEVSGHVYHDQNLNGHRDATEVGIAGVRVELLNATQQVIATAMTDASGQYLFRDLEMGTYRIRETQPANWLDGLEETGTVDGLPVGRVAANDAFDSVVLPSAGRGVNYNFGEYLPVSISGLVHSDPDHDCILDPDEVRLAGVRIELWSNGQLVTHTLTNERGEYTFQNLPPGIYTVREIQPAGYFQGGAVVGSGGGTLRNDDLVADIPTLSGQTLTGYNFCEIPPSELSGYVFQDGADVNLRSGETLPENIALVRDGVRTADDRPLPGIVLELRDGTTGRAIASNTALPGIYATPNIRTVTDSQGHYRFTGLPRGNYAVYEIHPEGYVDGVDTPGSTLGIPINAGQPVSPSILAALEEDPTNDAIVRIGLPAGEHSRENNFSEIRVTRPTPFVPYNPPLPGGIPDAIDLAITELQPTAMVRSIVPLVNPVRQPNRPRRAIGFTWHLSVTNGGYPRETSSAQHVDQRAGAPVWLPVEFTRNPRDGEWTLWTLDDDQPRPRKLKFGSPQAVPVAGDFNGDGSGEIGVFDRGHWFIDLNGNGIWDNADLWARLGYMDDLPVVGDWDGDGKDDIGIFGRAWPGDPRAVAAEPGLPDGDNQQETGPKNLPPAEVNAARGRRELQATAQGPVRTDVIDHVFHYGAAGDAPVTGDWNGDGIHSIGVYRGGMWRLDVDGDGQWSHLDRWVEFGAADDIPLAGDWNADGIDEVGVFRRGTFYLDQNANGQLDASDVVIESGEPEGRPVVGDWNGDGRDDVGIRSTHSSPALRQARR